MSSIACARLAFTMSMLSPSLIACKPYSSSMPLSSSITFLWVDVPAVRPFRVMERVSTREIVLAALSPYLFVISAASPDFVENRLKAVAAAATTDRTKPNGFALTAMLNRSIASFALVTLLDSDITACTVPQMFISLCAAATAKTAALYVPYVAITVSSTLPTVSQFSTRDETMSSDVPITPSEACPIWLNICSMVSSMLLIRPDMVWLCASIRPPNLLPSFVRLMIACSTSGNPTFPSSTSPRTWLSATPSTFANSPAKGIPLPRNWLRSAVYMRPCTIVVPYR